MVPERESQIVIGADGTVLGTTADLPAGLVDVRLEECQALPREVREAGTALLRELPGSETRMAMRTLTLDDGRRTIQVVAIEALAIRRMATDVRALLASKLGVISFQVAAAHVFAQHRGRRGDARGRSPGSREGRVGRDDARRERAAIRALGVAPDRWWNDRRARRFRSLTPAGDHRGAGRRPGHSGRYRRTPVQTRRLERPRLGARPSADLGHLRRARRHGRCAERYRCVRAWHHRSCELHRTLIARDGV
jgi:hypothetical protein